jgi:hypothetical protein
LFPLEKITNPQIQRLLTKHIFIVSEHAPVKRTFTATIHFPEMVLFRFDEANVVQVDLFVRRWSYSISTSGGRLVCIL